MPRFTAVEPQHADPKAQPLLVAVQQFLGVTPNMMRTMAERPAVLEGYLALSGALAKGQLGRRVGEQIALTVAEANGCGYCAAAHTLLGTGAGLSDADVEAAVLDARGHVTDGELAAARAAGLDDGDLGEVVAHVALNVFTNYFNSVADTSVDFPVVRPTRGAPARALSGAGV